MILVSQVIKYSLSYRTKVFLVFIFLFIGPQISYGNEYEFYNNGVRYYYGHGVRRDFKEALYWFKKAAHLGHRDAQVQTALIYGRGGYRVPRDLKASFDWWRQAALGGDQESQYKVAILYYNGEGVKRDYKGAFYWFEKAAQKGHSAAQYHLAEMYKQGLGVEKDVKKAEYWRKKIHKKWWCFW